MNTKNILAGVVLLIAIFNITPDKVVDYVKKANIVVPSVPAVVIDKPDDAFITKTKPVADLVTNKSDREMMAVFCEEFSNRKYTDVTMQNMNDILTEAGKVFFKGTLKGKYAGLETELVKLVNVQEIDSADNKLYPEQLKEISNNYKALAWNLVH